MINSKSIREMAMFRNSYSTLSLEVLLFRSFFNVQEMVSQIDSYPISILFLIFSILPFCVSFAAL